MLSLSGLIYLCVTVLHKRTQSRVVIPFVEEIKRKTGWLILNQTKNESNDLDTLTKTILKVVALEN
jgi:hypothetical protein